MRGDTERGGDIEQTSHADGGIDDETADGVARFLALALQHVIRQHDGRMKIVQGVVDTLARRLRHGAVSGKPVTARAT